MTLLDQRATRNNAELGLARVVLFSGLTEADLAALAGRLRRRRYARGEVIFLRGDPGGSLYIVAAGSIRIVLTSAEGKEMTLAMRGPGDFFGELALLDGEPRSADAVAQEPSELLLLQSEDFLSAPSSIHRTALSSSSSAESTITGTSLSRASSRRSVRTSKPFRPGIITSSSMRSMPPVVQPLDG